MHIGIGKDLHIEPLSQPWFGLDHFMSKFSSFQLRLSGIVGDRSEVHSFLGHPGIHLLQDHPGDPLFVHAISHKVETLSLLISFRCQTFHHDWGFASIRQD